MNSNNRCYDEVNQRWMVNDFDGKGWHPEGETSQNYHVPVVSSKANLRATQARLLAQARALRAAAKKLREAYNDEQFVDFVERMARKSARYLL